MTLKKILMERIDIKKFLNKEINVIIHILKNETFLSVSQRNTLVKFFINNF